MNKNINRIIALALAIGTISAVAPATSVNLLATKAYAATDDTVDNDEDEFDSLELLDDNDDTIKLYEDEDYDDRIDEEDLVESETYYAKTSSDTISIDISGVDDDYVKVFTSTSDSAKGKDVDDDISISDDKTITVKIYDQEPENNVRFDNEDEDAEVIGEYEIEVEYTGDSDDEDNSEDEDDAEDYDDIYLDKLTVGGKDISLSDSKVTYAYSVDSNVNEVVINAQPDDEDADNDYEVTIDGTSVEDDNYKKTVSLVTGVNEIKIELDYEDDDDDNYERDYTLRITKAAAVAIVVPTIKANQWVSINGRWQYNDSLGKTLMNQWLFDRNYSSWYFLGSDGNMQTGWILTGGKYYYLNTNGAMASNTTINGYKVGNDGAWII